MPLTFPVLTPPKKRERAEGKVSDAVLAAVELLGWCLLWRNTVGAGQINGHWMRWGLAVGSGDLIGVLTLKSGLGVFVSVETKRPKGGVIGPAQRAWHRKVTEAGGLSILGATSAAQVVEALIAFRDSH